VKCFVFVQVLLIFKCKLEIEAFDFLVCITISMSIPVIFIALVSTTIWRVGFRHQHFVNVHLHACLHYTWLMNSVVQQEHILSRFSALSEGTGYYESYSDTELRDTPVLTNGIID